MEREYFKVVNDKQIEFHGVVENKAIVLVFIENQFHAAFVAHNNQKSYIYYKRTYPNRDMPDVTVELCSQAEFFEKYDAAQSQLIDILSLLKPERAVLHVVK